MRSSIFTVRLLPLFCVFATYVVGQQYSSRDDAKEVLLETRKKLMLTVSQLPKYMCMETVDRSNFQPEVNVTGSSCDDLASLRRKKDWRVRKSTSDRLRLDVAVSSDSEMYSWAGEDRFQDRSLADLVGSGATSTGAFASFLVSIFETNGARFSYDGDVNADGRALVKFGFRVPLEKSGYRIGNKLHRAIVAYDGTFLVDPKTFDLVTLTIRADHLPAELKVCEDTTTLEYGSVRLNNSEFLLPNDVRLHVFGSDGRELENHTVFSGCHEFLGESSLRFGTASQSGQVAASKTESKALSLPAGLPFTLALTHVIETATAAAGDRVEARLTSPIREKHSGVLVPKGAAVTGRIVEIKRLYGPQSESLTLAIKLETIEAQGVPQPFNARLESIVKKHTVSAAASGKQLVVREDLGSFDEMSDREGPGVGFLEFQDVSKDYVINRGVEIEGTTAGAEMTAVQ